MKKLSIALLLLVLVSACAPAQDSQVVLPQLLPAATAYIDSSYPTTEANVSAAQQTAAGIDVRMNRAWMEGKNVNAEVCFSLPDASDWSIWAANLAYSGIVLQEYGTTLLSIQEPVNGLPGTRCDILTFVVAPDADLTSATINIDAIAVPPQPSDYCDIYLPKIQQSMLERGTGVTVDCVDVNGALTMQILGKPSEMSQEQAEQLVYSDEFYTVRGPWSFSFNLSQ